MTFIIKGAAKQYRVNDEGQELIINLAIENWWISDRESFLNRTPSPYNIVAVEDCEVLVADLASLENLKEQSRCFLEMAHKLDQNSFIASQKRIEAGMTFTAEQKLHYLAESNPSFITRFPQNVLASYLGLSPETFSRVRRAMMNH